MSATLRPDLASVLPLYCAAVEQVRFANLSALCRRLQVPAAELQSALDLARIHGSSHAVCDRLVLGKPEDRFIALLYPQPGGAVVLCLGLLASLSPDEETARAEIAMLSEMPLFKGHRFMLCEFWHNLKGALH